MKVLILSENVNQLLQNLQNLLDILKNYDWKLMEKTLEEKNNVVNSQPWNEKMIVTYKEVERLNNQIKKYGEILEFMKIIELLLDKEVWDENLALCEIKTQISNANSLIVQLKFTPEDGKDCFLEIYSGTGGTDAQDWAEMLQRMYIGWCEKNNLNYEIMENNYGKQCGIKNTLIKITGGHYLYGHLKNEVGIHRLIRLSPFNANSKRHTSFASVNVFPIVEEDNVLQINANDLLIDTYRSSGAGGQHVNTTDSAVRITHIPTGIVVQCQKERSQHANKDTAMKILKSKIIQQNNQKAEEEKQRQNKEKPSIGFGYQKRSYTLHPYKLVKDHISGYETSQVESVLSGELNELMEYCKS